MRPNRSADSLPGTATAKGQGSRKDFNTLIVWIRRTSYGFRTGLAHIAA